MPSGRPPNPPKNAARPRPRAGIPKCPDNLSAAAKAKWKVLVKDLKEAGILTLVDTDNLGAYCECFATWQLANDMVVKGGVIQKGPNGGLVQNPFFSVRNKAAAEMRKYSVMLGLDPASRQRLIADAAPPAKGGKSRFFKGREGA